MIIYLKNDEHVRSTAVPSDQFTTLRITVPAAIITIQYANIQHDRETESMYYNYIYADEEMQVQARSAWRLGVGWC